MTDQWLAISCALALVVLLVLIIRFKVQAFVTLLVVSLGFGLIAGMPPLGVVRSVNTGFGSILGGVTVVLALGALLGRMLDVSGAAEVIARTTVRAFGPKRAALAILVASYLIGIPVMFNVGFLLLMPIMWRLHKETGRSLLYFAMPLALGLMVPHSLVPPHPGIVGAVNMLRGNSPRPIMLETILFGTLLGVPMVLVGWFGPGRWWAKSQYVEPPELLAASLRESHDDKKLPSFTLSLAIVLSPLILSLVGFGATLLVAGSKEKEQSFHVAGAIGQIGTPGQGALLASSSYLASKPLKRPGLFHHPSLEWLEFLGHPTMALLIATGLAFWLLGFGRGMSATKLAKVAGEALLDVGPLLFLFGGAGGFMEIIKETGAGALLARQFQGLPLPNVLIAFFVALLVRSALGSATASTLMAAGLLERWAGQLPGQETMIILAVACGATGVTQPADSGFWQVKEYCNLSVRDVLVRFNLCKITMAVTGLAILLLIEAFWR